MRRERATYIQPAGCWFRAEERGGGSTKRCRGGRGDSPPFETRLAVAPGKRIAGRGEEVKIEN